MEAELLECGVILTALLVALGFAIQQRQSRLALVQAEGKVLLRQEMVGRSLSEIYRFARRTIIEIKKSTGNFRIKKSRSPYQIIDGCISCGSCKAACPYPIIEDGYPYRINSTLCVGCDLCNKACPVDTCRPIYNGGADISIHSDTGVGLYSVPRRETIRKLIDLDLAQRIHGNIDNTI